MSGNFSTGAVEVEELGHPANKDNSENARTTT
jgi:hypothetical protein